VSSHKRYRGHLRPSISRQVGRAFVEVAAEILPALAVESSKGPKASLLILLKQRVKTSLLEPFPASEIHTVH